MNMTTAPKTDLRELIQTPGAMRELERVLPDHMTADRQVRIILSAMGKTPKLQRCSKESFIESMMSCSEMGLEPNGRHAHLIPYGSTCTLVVDYKGLKELAFRSGHVASIHADVVRQNDEFSHVDGVVHHSIDWRQPRGDIFAVYCIVKLTNGGRKDEVMSVEDVELIRQRSAGANSPAWNDSWAEMAKKTVFKRASKYIPESPCLTAALMHEERQEFPQTPPRGLGVQATIQKLDALTDDTGDVGGADDES